MYFNEICCMIMSGRKRLGKEVPTENMDVYQVGGKTG
jgi:hypothetical protein